MRSTDNDPLAQINKLKKLPGFFKLKWIYAIGSNADLIAKNYSDILNLKSIKKHDLLLYPIDQVLVVFESEGEEMKRFEKFGYWVVSIE